MQHTVITRRAITVTRTRHSRSGSWENTYVPIAERRALVALARRENPQHLKHAAVEVDYGFAGGTRVTFDDTRPVEAGF